MTRLAPFGLAAVLSITIVGTTTGQTTWSGLGDGTSWSDPSNWDPAGTPGDTDSVLVGVSATIVVDAPATVKSLTLTGFDATLDLVSSLTVNGTLQQASSTSEITGAADLTVNGLYDWQAGTLSGPGDTGVDGDVHLSTGGAKVLDGRRFRKIPGRLKYVQSGWNFSAGNGAVIELAAGDELLIDTPSGSGAFDVFDGSVSPPVIDNSGVIHKVGGTTGIVVIEWDVDNKGTVEVDQAGGLRLDGALLSSAGTFQTLTADAVLDFGGAGETYNFDVSSVLSGTGTIAFSSGTATVAGTLDVGTTEITDRLNNGASVTIAATAQLPADFDVLTVATRGDLTVELTSPITASSLTMDFGSRLTVSSAMSVSGNVQLLERSALFSSSEDLTVGGLLTWQGGTLAGSGQTVANGGVVITGSAGSSSFDKALDGRALIVPSGQSLIVTGASGASLGNGSVLEIASGATMDIQTEADFRLLAGSATEPVIRNSGVLKKTGGGFQTWVDVDVENGGTIEVSDGELRLSADLTDNGGTYRATDAATLIFGSNDNEIVFRSSSRLEGEGVIRFVGQGKNVSIEGTLDMARLEVSGGNTLATVTVAATADVVRVGSESLKIINRGNLITLFGDPIVTTSFELGALSELTLNSPLTVTENWLHRSAPNTLRTDFPVSVDGAATWQGGGFQGGGSIRFNAGLEMTGDASSADNRKTLDQFHLVVPAGQTATVLGSANTLLGNGAVLEVESGATMDVQTEADFRLLSGSASEPVIRNSGVYKKTGGGFQTWVDVDVENGGTIEVSDGELRLSADLTDNGGTYRALTGGARLSFASVDNEVVFGSSSRLEGEGTIQFTGQGKSVSIEGTIDAANFSVSGGNTLSTVTVASTAEVRRIGSESLTVTGRGNLVTLFTDPIQTRSFELSSLSETTLNSRLRVTDNWLMGFAPNSLRTEFPVIVDGPATWQGGRFEGRGSVRFNGGLEIVGDAGSASFSKALDGFRLVIPSGATANYTGTRNLEGGNGAVIEVQPGAVLDIQTEADIRLMPGSTVVPRLENAGTLLKSGGGFATQLAWEVVNTGLISITNSELVCCTGQHLRNETGGVISGTSVLDVQQATFTNSGTIAPGGDSPGTLVIRGDYVNAPGTLRILMDGPDASRLDVEGTATLGGHLGMVNPAGPLPDGTRYQILTATAVADTFATVEGPLLFSSEADVAYALTEVVVDIVPVANRAPEAWPDVVYTLRDSSVTIDVLWNDVDLDKDSLEIVSATDGSIGTTAVLADRIVYNPVPGATGVDAFTYVARDPDGEETSDSVVVEVVEPALSLLSFAGPETPGSDPGIFRQRSVAVDFGLLADLVSGVEDRIALPLFDGGLTVVSRGWTENWPDGQVSWIGSSDRSGDYVILEIDLASETLYARGRGSTQAVTINKLPDGSHQLREMDPAAFPESVNDRGTGDLSRFEGEEIPVLDVTEQMFNPEDSIAGKRAHSVVDILVLYTSFARAAAGSDAAMISQIRSVVNLTNLTFSAGLLDVRLRLAAAAEVQFRESGEIGDDLDKLIAVGTRSSSALARLRSRYGADIVGLIISTVLPQTSPGKAGAWFDPDPDEAFFVAEDNAAFGANLTFTHEMGHLFGAEHDEEVVHTLTSDAGWVNPPKFWTATGDRFTGGAPPPPWGPNQWRTIMAYPDHCDHQRDPDDDSRPGCPRAPRWSDPNDKWSNAAGGPFRPLGDHPPLGADNNDRIRRFAPTVAGWMSPAPVISGVVLDAQTGLPINSVLIQQSSESGVDDTTDMDGSYEIVAPRSETVTITPVHADYIFSPASASFTTTTSFNFTGYRLYDVTGRVNEGLSGLRNVRVRATPQAGLTPPEIAITAENTTDAFGDYSLVLPFGWSGLLTTFIRSHDISPAEWNVDLIDSDSTFNFSASIKKYTISLSLRDVTTNLPIAGARVTRWGNDTTDSSGFFSREVEHDQGFELLPRHLGYNFDPFVVDTSVTQDFHFDFNGFPGGVARSDWPKQSQDPGNRGALSAPTADGRAKWWQLLSANPVGPVVGPEGLILAASFGTQAGRGAVEQFDQTGQAVGGVPNVTAFHTPSDMVGPVLGTGGYVFVAWSSQAANVTGVQALSYVRGTRDVASPLLTGCCVRSIGIGPDASIYVVTGATLYRSIPMLDESGGLDQLSSLQPFFAAANPLSGSPAIDENGNLYIGDEGGTLHAVDSAGNLLWSVSTGAAIRGSPVRGADGSVYVGSESGQLVAVSSTGTLQWAIQTGAAILVQPVIGSDGTVYVGNIAGRLVAVGPANGQLRWSLTLPGPVSAVPAVSNIRVRRLATTADEEVLYVPVSDTVLYAVNAVGSSAGTIRWALVSMAERITSPALSRHGLYFGEHYPSGIGRLVRVAPLSRAHTQYTVVRQDGFLLPDELAVILWAEQPGGPLAFVDGLPDDPCEGGPLYIPGCPLLAEYDKATPLLTIPAETDLALGLAERTSAIDAIAAGETTEGLLLTTALRLGEDEVRVVVVGGLTDTTGFAPNPEGVSAELGVFLSENLHDIVTSDDMVYVLTGSLVTDASAMTFTLIGQQTTAFDATSFGELSPVLALQPGAFQLTLDYSEASGKSEVQRRLFQVDLSDQAGELVTLLSTGFVDPSANRNGPGVTVVGASSSGPVLVSTEETDEAEQPAEFAVHGIYPNPFVSEATIRYAISRRGHVRINLYDVIGRRVGTVVDRDESPGIKEVLLRPRALASGLYFVRFEAEGAVRTEKVILAR